MIYEDGLTTLVVEHRGLAACRADIKQRLIADFEGSPEACREYGWVIQELLESAIGPGMFMSNLWFPPNRGGLLYAASRAGAVVFS